MGYEVNRLAQNLRTQRAGAIGLYLPPDSTGHEYYLAFAFGVMDGAMTRETPVVMIPSGTSEASLARDHVDGYIVVDAIDQDAQLARILATGKPVVAAEPLPPGSAPAAGVVTLDHERVLDELLNHLTAKGAHRTALISPPLNTAWARQVTSAYDAWCRRSGNRSRVVTAPFVADAGSVQQPVDELFAAAEVPDAIVVAQDGIASAVSAAVAAKGFVIGRDVLLAACVDGVGVWSSTPPITAVDLRPREHGKACADMLLGVLADSDHGSPAALSLQSRLHVRASTSRAAG